VTTLVYQLSRALNRSVRRPARYSHLAFRTALADNPRDHTNSLVYADWLDERAHPLAELIRHSVHMTPDEVARESLIVPGQLLRTYRSIHRADGVVYGVTRHPERGYIVNAFVHDPNQDHLSHPSSSRIFYKPMVANEVLDFFHRLGGDELHGKAMEYVRDHPAPGA